MNRVRLGLLSWPNFKNQAPKVGRGVAKTQDLPAELIISYLSGDTVDAFALDTKLDGRILEKVLAPVLTGDSTGGSVERSLVANKAKLHRPTLAGFPPDGRQVSDDTRPVRKIHTRNIEFAAT